MSKTGLLSTILFLAVPASIASAQGLPPPPSEYAGTSALPAGGPAAFDVASVHEHPAGDQMKRWMTKADGISVENIELQSLIASAFKVKLDLVSGGPSWVDSKGFDINAKVLPADGAASYKLTQAQQRALLLALLKDRFHLQAHIESKILPVYDLEVAKGGLRMHTAPVREAAEDDQPGNREPGDLRERGSMNMAPGHLQAHAYKVGPLAETLGYVVQRTVLDHTGLTGEYDFNLNWADDDQLMAAGDKASNGADSKPSIFVALEEQLGLKLVPGKGPVDTVVIDHVDLPTAN